MVNYVMDCIPNLDFQDNGDLGGGKKIFRNSASSYGAVQNLCTTLRT
jgi:hypothetical protein